MDPFQIRMEFLSVLKRLNASQQSIHKLVSFAVRHASRCADDIWECLVQECEKASLNTRINLLFLLDALLSEDAAAPQYRPLVASNLPHFIDLVVPPASWDAILNIGSAQQILSSWKTKRVFDISLLGNIQSSLDTRRLELHDRPSSEKAEFANFSRTDILRRIEEDRERHKRLRERIWILPPTSYADTFPALGAASQAQQLPSASSSAKTSPASPRDPDLASASPVGVRRTAGNVRPLVAGPPKDPRLAARAASGAAAAAVKRASATTPQAGSGPRPPAKRHKADHNARSGIAEAFDESDVEMNAFDIELEEAWDNTSELNEDDLDAIQDENERWWGHEGGADVDVGEEPPEQAWQDRPEQDHEALAAVSDIPLGFSLHGESGLGATPAASHTPPAPPALGRPHGAFNATQLSDHGSPYQSTPRGPAFLSQTHPGVGRAPLGRPLAGPPVPSRFTSPSGRRERR